MGYYKNIVNAAWDARIDPRSRHFERRAWWQELQDCRTYHDRETCEGCSDRNTTACPWFRKAQEQEE